MLYSMSIRSQNDQVVTREQERSERAARVTAMLERWAQQDVSREPEWDIDDVQRLRLGRVDAESDEPAD
jgi:hypothetical protein